MKFRASQLGKLMTSSRTKGEALSQTAKSYIIQQAKEDFFVYRTELNSKYIIKGLTQEQDSIDLLNLVRLEDYKKNVLFFGARLERQICNLRLSRHDVIGDVLPKRVPRRPLGAHRLMPPHDAARNLSFRECRAWVHPQPRRVRLPLSACAIGR